MDGVKKKLIKWLRAIHLKTLIFIMIIVVSCSVKFIFPLASFSISDAFSVMTFLAASIAILIAFPFKPIIEFLDPAYFEKSIFAATIKNKKYVHETCRIRLGFKNCENFSLEPKITIVVPSQLRFMYAVDLTTLIPPPLNLFFVPRENSNEVVVVVDDKPKLGVRADIFGEKYGKVSERETEAETIYYFSTPMVFPGEIFEFWIRIKIPDDTNDHRIILHLTTPFLQQNKHQKREYLISRQEIIEKLNR